jgi:hypothetical protein
MPYQGSAQSVGFRNRTVIDPSQRMRQEAELVEQQGRERVRQMETQASQQIQEMTRVSDLQADNSRYELQALSQFSKSINNLLQEDLVEEVKRRRDEEVQEGMRLYAEQGPDYLQQKKEVETAAQRSAELHVKTNELANQQPSTEAADRIRQLSKHQQLGWNMAAMKQAGASFGSHLLAELENNTTRIVDPATGQEFVLKDYKGTSQYEAATKYLQTEYIKNNNPGGLSAKVVNTLLIPEVLRVTQTQRQEYVQRYRRETAIESLDAEENLLYQSLVGTEGFVDAGTALQNFFKVAPKLLDTAGTPEGGNRAARKLAFKLISDLVQEKPDRVDSVIQTLDSTLIDHPAGKKSLFALFGDEINPTQLKAVALQAKFQKYEENKKIEDIEAKESYEAVLTAFQKGASDIDRIQLVREFSDKFPAQVSYISQLASWEPAVLSITQSELKMQALKDQFGGEIPKSQIGKNIAPEVLQKYQRDIVETPFGSASPEAIKSAQRMVTASIKEARSITATDAVMYDDAIRAERAAHAKIMPRAKQIFQQAQAAGQPISHSQAIQMAGDEVAEYVEKSQADPKSIFYAEAGKGFTKFEKPVGTTGAARALNQQLTVYRKAQNMLTKDSNALVSKPIITNKVDLEPSLDGTPKPFVYELAKLDKRGRTAFDILNAQRKLQNLPPVKMPAEAQKLQSVLDKYPEVKRAFSQSQSFRTIQRGITSIGGVSVRSLMKAIGFQESGGNYKARNADAYGASNPALGKYQILWSNVIDWSKKAGMGHPGSMSNFLNNPQYQERLAEWAFNDYVRQAYKRTKDPKIAIRMAAAAWYGGAGSMMAYDRTNKETGGRYPSMREYTTSVLNKYLSGI